MHDAELVGGLGVAHDEWIMRYGPNASAAIPSAWPARGMRAHVAPDIESRLGSFTFDTATPITKGTWSAARAAVDVALSAANAIREGERSAFALTRPPGHHASADIFGGYCYLNNAAIAAQWLADNGMRPAILDVDYHHGNGTQAIFYAREDVFYGSIHADPSFAYPHFAGFADERGERTGENANLNLPLPAGTEWAAYSEALADALKTVRAFGPDVLLVSLGLDTFENDPISDFKLKSADYLLQWAKRSRSLRHTPHCCSSSRAATTWSRWPKIQSMCWRGFCKRSRALLRQAIFRADMFGPHSHPEEACRELAQPFPAVQQAQNKRW